MIERDDDIPPLADLLGELAIARRLGDAINPCDCLAEAA